MSTIPIYKGKKINRFLCLGMAAAAVVSLAAAGALYVAGKENWGAAILILGLITGGFALLYGILWAVFAKREKKAELALQAAEAAKLKESPQEEGAFGWREFVLPKQRLTEAAFRRFTKGFQWVAIIALILFVLMTGSMIRAGSFGGPLHALAILGFCVAISIPGLIVQGVIYRKYEKAVPERILLYPGSLTVDGRVFSAQEIRGVSISPPRVYNVNSPAVFRGMEVRTADGEKRYTIDFRSDRSVSWEEYPQFAEALLEWGEANRIPVTTAYME